LHRLFQKLKKFDYKTVVIISPDHFLSGSRQISVSGSSWPTTSGELRANSEVVNYLLSDPKVALNDQGLAREHGITNLLPFIAKNWPEARVVPVTIQYNLHFESMARLATELRQILDSRHTLVLASVDFSHYLPRDIADFHDEFSLLTIERFDYSRIPEMEIDSPETIDTLLRYLDSLGACQAQLEAHTNSATILGVDVAETTSHLFFTFRRGEKETGDFSTNLIIPDITSESDRTVFEQLAGEENRLFYGQDQEVFRDYSQVTDLKFLDSLRLNPPVTSNSRPTSHGQTINSSGFSADEGALLGHIIYPDGRERLYPFFYKKEALGVKFILGEAKLNQWANFPFSGNIHDNYLEIIP
jgi:AmmeMemoRadiSam system protein B